MTHPESAETPFDDIDNEFAALLNGETQRIHHGYMVRSLANEKARILDALVDQMIAFDSVSIGSYENFTRLIDAMTSALEKDFMAIEGINYEDEIIASGKTVALITDKNDPTREVFMQPIDEGECIRGELDRIVLVEIPSFEKIRSVIQDHEPIRDATDNNDFGIALRLKNAYIENDELDTEPIPENYIVRIPLNYPTLVLDAVVKTEKS